MSSTTPQLLTSPTPPWILEPGWRWVTVKQFSILYCRSQRRVQQMLLCGDMMAFGIATYQDPMGRWWLRIPQE